MRRTRKIQNFPLPIFWDSNLMTAAEYEAMKMDEMDALMDYEAEMAAERYYERGGRSIAQADDFYQMEEDEKRMAGWGF